MVELFDKVVDTVFALGAHDGGKVLSESSVDNLSPGIELDGARHVEGGVESVVLDYVYRAGHGIMRWVLIQDSLAITPVKVKLVYDLAAFPYGDTTHRSFSFIYCRM